MLLSGARVVGSGATENGLFEVNEAAQAKQIDQDLQAVTRQHVRDLAVASPTRPDAVDCPTPSTAGPERLDKRMVEQPGCIPRRAR